MHPGWGFLAENPAFARACEENDLVFVGPTPDVMARMGDKAQAKHELRAAGVPLVPGTDGTATIEQARAAADELGFPVLLKAAAGGGGKGMRLVESQDELEDAFGSAAAEALAAFGDPALYVEKVIEPARHVEIQVLADSQGGVLTLGERECSIQRRHQKLIEESPSPALTHDSREEMEAAAERAVRTIGYRNAGTFEFLVGLDGSFHFIELNARLQVEHPVSELCTGIDIVHEQLRVAAGEPLGVTGRAPRRGHAIEIRINAEDPRRNFTPAPGVVSRFRPPLGPGVRVDTAVEDGSVVPPYYDSLIAKVIVWDADRPSAIARAQRALGELEIDGVPTTREAALEVLATDEFASGDYSTAFLEELLRRGRLVSRTRRRRDDHRRGADADRRRRSRAGRRRARQEARRGARGGPRARSRSQRGTASCSRTSRATCSSAWPRRLRRCATWTCESTSRGRDR